MTNFTWLDEYSVGVDELDFHHKKIISLINNLKNSKINETNSILLELRDYAIYHLATEEEYFKKFNYPNTDEHIQQHNKFREQINILINEKNSDTFDINKVIQFLEKWWINHILNEDKKYKTFFNENGLS